MTLTEVLKGRYPSLTPETLAQITELLNHKIVVRLEQPVHGYWDGGAKSHFEFTPDLRHYSDGNLPNIEWGSWGANWWFRVELGKSAARHFGTVKRKLRGSPGRTITVEER